MFKHVQWTRSLKSGLLKVPVGLEPQSGLLKVPDGLEPEVWHKESAIWLGTGSLAFEKCQMA